MPSEFHYALLNSLSKLDDAKEALYQTAARAWNDADEKETRNAAREVLAAITKVEALIRKEKAKDAAMNEAIARGEV